jgi:DNA-directed RNA polymerase subunit RPC12/RpoP
MTSDPHPGGGWLLKLTGIIDETFDRTKLAFGAQDTLVFDLDGVRRITSYGVREWIAAMGNLQASCYFIRCRPAVVSQFNMVQNFGGRGQVVSLFAPYACSACGKEIEVLVDRRHPPSAQTLALPTLPCPSCGAEAEFDDIPETFFSYVSAAPPLSLSLLAESIIDGAPTSLPSSRLSVAKEVQGQVTALWLAGPLDKAAHLKRVADGLEGIVVIMLTSVPSVTLEGLERFNVFARQPNVDLYLTRLPVSIGASLTRSPELMAKAKVLTVRVLFVCPTCGKRSEIDADGGELKRATENRVYQLCNTCGVLMKPPAPQDLREALKLTFAPMPPSLRSYLFGSPEAFLESASGPQIPQPPLFPSMPPSARRPSFTPTPTNQEQYIPPEPHSNSLPPSSQVPQSSSPHSAPHSSSHSSSGPYSRRPGESVAPARLSRYEIMRRLGTGGMATVYLGRVVAAGGFERLVAIKIMHPHIANDPACVAMFLDEARLAARIRHPNVVPTLDVEETPEALMMVMEYVEGLTLNQIFAGFHRQKRKLPLPVAIRIMIDVLAGLHAAHELREPDGTSLELVHRDVSPHNMIVGVDGIARVTDFGIAHAQTRLGSSTKRGEIKGKVGYMSPEQIRSYRADRRSDIYAMGVVMWEMLVGQRLFKGESEAAVLFSANQGVEHAPIELDKTIPRVVSDVCMRALKPIPDERFETAADFAEEIERAASEAGIYIAPGREVTAVVKEAIAMRPEKK